MSSEVGKRARGCKVAVVTFPGTNCDHDLEHVAGDLFGCAVEKVWHRGTTLNGPDIVFLPGGFAYGDYLRTGALAALSPIMGAVKEFAANGGVVVGICNGFQILCEAQLLPGALLPNAHGSFAARWVEISVNTGAASLSAISDGTVIRCPVAHGEGNYFADAATLDDLARNRQIVFRYRSGGNPNGSARDIAGISNRPGNVIGLMPHPERACEAVQGSDSGRVLFEALLRR